jgi:GT2 family glycosyltransferase
VSVIPAKQADGRGARDGGAPSGDRDLAPAGIRLVPDSGTRLVARGAVLVGGYPVRVLRLTPGGSRQVAAWLDGTPVPGGQAARKLARRLLDAGIAHPDLTVRAGAGSLTDTGSLAGTDSPGEAVSPADTDFSGTADPAGDTSGARAGAGAARLPGAAAPPASLPAPGFRGPALTDVTVVIPVRDRHAELARCLAGLGDVPQVIVVDDASGDPVAIKRIAADQGATVLHRPVNGGPAAARNTGLAAAGTDFVAFLDSDCVPRPGWLAGLLPHFADPAVGAVAPRIVPHEQGDGWLARYEGASSTLDMGARPSIVRPGSRVPYVPGAALVVRRAAAGGGFRDGMYVGEDVDFVWRLAAAGWRVRYEPGAVMGHDHRVAFRAWFARRADYGTSAAALENLHPGAVRPLYASWWTLGAWAALLSGRPVTAAALTGAATALLARRLSRVTGERWPLPARPGPAGAGSTGLVPDPAPFPDNSIRRVRDRLRGLTADVWAPYKVPKRPVSSPEVDNSKKSEHGERRAGPEGSAAWALAVRLAGGGTLAAGRPLGSAMSRTWWPVAIPAALVVRKLRRPVAVLILAPPLLDWADRRPPLDPARYVAARLLDDAAYSIGVWQGCLARRTVRPLLPVIGGKRQPG